MPLSLACEGRVRPILKHKAPELRQVCPPFVWDSPDHAQGLADLLATMIDTPRARGLAAPQIGFMARVFVMQGSERLIVCANPRVESSSLATVTMEEECMSFPNIRARLVRPAEGTVSFYPKPYEMETSFLTGWDFRCFLHELDHLNGITIDMMRRQ